MTTQMISDNQETATNYVPVKDPTFVEWGHYDIVERIVANKSMFFPVYVQGLSGNGKTHMIQQACANIGREVFRVQINPETDEDDLIGGIRLKNGDTVFEEGPVITAMRRGALLLLDEIDRSTNKIMCLQGVLEGNPVMIKKTQEVVTPAPGFNVIATANTRGRGDNDGRFTAAAFIDDAFLERFHLTLRQPYPCADIERRILLNNAEKYGVMDIVEDESDVGQMIGYLVNWAKQNRASFDSGQDREVITTRRLIFIIQTFVLTGDWMEAVNLCLSRFDDAESAYLYKAFDAQVPDKYKGLADHNGEKFSDPIELLDSVLTSDIADHS